ncbi:hypothetical protein BCR33DRAFT_765648 [Rhizoclosmatium globosum]|uniref:G-protein coupled receptors family 2 profile 2 domain-containing protein n=1 Tax=Rhizoclosmatium globosum TaxID=329046 RepID=A0A1Y2CDU8_9FUNG|nr:hypothetical protein BCR33DRAFT_765648 [Rhizoclosmatium globosum]|eukprot:ORY45238.1 hypothetical protein BCR33DRAFT_765648 [Rhizoclosmatium globosum]
MNLSYYVFCPIYILLDLGLIVCVSRMKRFQKTMSYLQIIIAICEIVPSIFWMIEDRVLNHESLCAIVGVVNQFFFNSQSCWNFLVSLYCYFTVTVSVSTANEYSKWFSYYGIGFPAILTILPFCIDAIWKQGFPYGNAIYDCWISNEYPRLRIALYYVQLWFHFAGIIILLARVFYH